MRTDGGTDCVMCGAPAFIGVSGKPSMYCSEKCRKTKYAGACEDCGKPTHGGNGRGPKAPRWCADCLKSHCSELRTYWTRDRLIERIQAWAELYGRPPSGLDWHPTRCEALGLFDEVERWESGEWPWFSSVFNRFGSWNAAIEAAGFEPRPAHHPRMPKFWTRDVVVEAIREWADEHGEPPRVSDWMPAPSRRWPSPRTVFEVWGSWNAAIEAAGFTGRRGRPGKVAA